MAAVKDPDQLSLFPEFLDPDPDPEHTRAARTPWSPRPATRSIRVRFSAPQEGQLWLDLAPD